MASVEYAIWGIASGDSEERVLLSQYKGNPLTDRKFVDAAVKVLELKGCRECRVQTITFDDNLGFET
jgi:hypothetical protein